MDVSYSVWLDVAAERLELEGESFSFLFDRRYSNRLNRMSRVFFEAYAKATLEVSAEEDRFPSLSEIESRMESGAIYAYKDRLMRSTGFFEEVKVSGISYLIPRAKRFIDETGTYTDLILNLEVGGVILPRREKPSAAVARPEEEEEATAEELLEALAEGEEEEEEEPFGEETSPDGETEAPMLAGDLLGGDTASGGKEVEAEEGRAGSGSEEPAPAESPSKVEAEAPKIEVPPETPPETDTGGEGAEGAESFVGYEEEEKPQGPPPREEFADAAVPRGAPAAEPAAKPQASDRVTLPPPHPPGPKGGEGLRWWGRGEKGPILALGALALVILMAAAFFFWPLGPEAPVPPSDFVGFAAYLSNNSGNTYLNLEVTNPKGLESTVELVLPPDVDKSISATGGIVTISYTNNTIIQLASRNNATVSVALTEEYILVPVTFNLAIPTDYESSVLVYDKDYQVSRTNSTISLLCNCTGERLEFDQIYNAKKVAGGPGPQERGPENATSSPPAGAPGPQP